MLEATTVAGIDARQAVRGEAEALSALCWRSKAHWGYDAAFMAQCADALTVHEEQVEAGRVVAAVEGPVIVGVAAVDFDAAPPDLSIFFVAPEAMGRGVGRRLIAAAVDLVRAAGGTMLEVLSDPHAEGFYRRMGAVRIGDAPSDAIPGRRLPLLRLAL